MMKHSLNIGFLFTLLFVLTACGLPTNDHSPIEPVILPAVTGDATTAVPDLDSAIAEPVVDIDEIIEELAPVDLVDETITPPEGVVLTEVPTSADLAGDISVESVAPASIEEPVPEPAPVPASIEEVPVVEAAPEPVIEPVVEAIPVPAAAPVVPVSEPVTPAEEAVPTVNVETVVPESGFDRDAIVPVATPGEVFFTITGGNFYYDIDDITVEEGDIVTINFRSEDGFHDWVIDEFDAATNKISTGQDTNITFTADKKGTFEFYCSVGNHRAQGMVGTLTVE